MVELIRREDDLNTGRKKLNNAIKAFNETVVEGDSSVEAAQARVDENGEVHPTLKARIDAGFKKNTQQLAQIQSEVSKKANENEVRMKRDKIEPEDASEELLALMTGEGTIDLKTIPQDGSVSPKSTNDISGLNMYPFHRKAILSEDFDTALQISRAIIDVEIFNANYFSDYYIRTIRRAVFRENANAFEWGVWLYDGNGNEVSRFRERLESPESDKFTGFKRIELSEVNSSGVSGIVLINWDALENGFEVTGNNFNHTGLDRKTRSELGAFMTTENEEWVI